MTKRRKKSETKPKEGISEDLARALKRAGVGSYVTRRLPATDLLTMEDFLWWLPFRYEDRRVPLSLSEAVEGMTACFSAKLASLRSRRAYRGRMAVTEGILNDAGGSLHVIWFNQPWLADSLEKGGQYMLYGRVGRFSTRAGFRLQLENPEVEKIEGGSGESVHLNRIVPVYGKAGSLKSKSLRTMFHKFFKSDIQVEEVLPAALRRELGLSPRSESFREVHFPGNETPIEKLERRSTIHQRRLIFDELLAGQWATALAAKERESLKGVRIAKLRETGEMLRKILPFKLTAAQKRVFGEIVDDLASPRAMYRLLHGDVGSGKTIIAFLAMFMAAHQGFQSIFMAPTEVLARQQFLKLSELAEKTGFEVAFLAASTRAAERRRVLKALSDGSVKLAVGTHSLFQEGVSYANPGMVVIDEQHRFGVEQRAALVRKGQRLNVLVMSATPIPRSLALTLYGDLELSVIDEMPPGRIKVKTVIRDERARRKMEAFIRKEMDEGGQIFYVFPLVEESEAVDLHAAKEAYERLRLGAFRGYRTALLYGGMKAAEKEAVMEAVRAGNVQLLVATTIVELGVDLPGASVMVVENAERFGLAQLHQLRGRVGRGDRKSLCVLMHSDKVTPVGMERLEVLERTNDGFEIAEADLKLRGPGDPTGTRQWGGGVFKIANPLRDHDLLAAASEASKRLARSDYPWEGNEKEVFTKWIESRSYCQGSYGRIG